MAIGRHYIAWCVLYLFFSFKAKGITLVSFLVFAPAQIVPAGRLVVLHFLYMYGAVDIGGTKTLVAAFSAEGELVEKYKFPTPQDYAQFIMELQKVFTATFAHHDFLAVGVAAPGNIDQEHGIGRRFGNLAWKNVPIQSDVESIFRCPSVLENDAKLAGLSEARLIPQYHKVLYVTISTGIGTGVIVDGKIAPDYADMEGGLITLEHEGSLRQWQDFASGKAILARYGKQASDIVDPAIWQTLARDFASGLLAVLAITQPNIVIIGGGVGAHFDRFGAPLIAELRRYETPMVPIPPIQRAERPEDAVIYGCALLARERYALVRA